MENSYKIVKKQFTGIDISDLVIENKEGKHKLISKQDAIKLARGNKIENAKAILDTDSGEYLIDIENGLSSLETISKGNSLTLELKARLIVDNKCVGYKAEDIKGKTYTLSIEKVWELAEQGSVKGIQAKIINNKKSLISTDEVKLDNLPKIKNN